MKFATDFEHNEKLFQAAIDEFAANGYDQASINTILTNAGMSKGQFYYHFENKQGLYFALIETMIAQKQAFMQKVVKPEDLQQDFFSVLAAQIQYGLAFAEQYPQIDAFSTSFLKEQGKPMYAAVLARFNFDNNAGLNQLIEAAYAQGEFREDLPLPFIQKTIGYLFTHTADFTTISGMDDAEQNLLYLVDFMKNGLTKQ